MKYWILFAIAVTLSAGNSHALLEILSPEPEPEYVQKVSSTQINCTENGMFIFEGFPDIVRDHPIMTARYIEQDNPTDTTANTVRSDSGCLER